MTSARGTSPPGCGVRLLEPPSNQRVGPSCRQVVLPLPRAGGPSRAYRPPLLVLSSNPECHGARPASLPCVSVCPAARQTAGGRDGVSIIPAQSWHCGLETKQDTLCCCPALDFLGLWGPQLPRADALCKEQASRKACAQTGCGGGPKHTWFS